MSLRLALKYKLKSYKFFIELSSKRTVEETSVPLGQRTRSLKTPGFFVHDSLVMLNSPANAVKEKNHSCHLLVFIMRGIPHK